MGKFHRFVDPTYALFSGESFPASPGGTGTIGPHTYDRVNVISGGVGASGSALADGQKSGGPNDNTYLVAFGEQGSSANWNRGLRAAFESLDVVDDVLRGSLPKRVSQSAASPGANSIAITGDVFVGDSGAVASELVWVVNAATGLRIYNGTTPVTVTDIDNGTPGSSVVGTGWFTNPTVRFSAAVNVAYTLYYGGRTSYARVLETERHAWWGQAIASSKLALDGASLSQHGLDERYRRSTSISSASPTVDTPGSGATITRDGQGLLMVLPLNDWSSLPYPDPWLAAHRAEHEGFVATAQTTHHGGDIGYLAFSPRRATSSVNERSASGPLASAFAAYIPRDIQSTTVNGTSRTYIPAGAPAMLNPSGAGASMVRLTAPAYFKRPTGSGDTAIYPDADILVVDFGAGVVKAFVISSVTFTSLADNEVLLRLPSGSTPSFSADTPVNVTWYSAYTKMGGSLSNSLEYYAPRALGTGGQSHTGSATPALALYGRDGFGPSNSFEDQLFRISSRGDDSTEVLALAANSNGDLYGGSLLSGTTPTTSQRGMVRSALCHRATEFNYGSGSHDLYIDPRGNTGTPGLDGVGWSMMTILVTSGSPTTINVTSSTLTGTSVVGMMEGLEFELVVQNRTLTGTGGSLITMTWDSSFIFSDPSDALFISTMRGSVVRWRGRRTIKGDNTGAWLMERFDYQY